MRILSLISLRRLTACPPPLVAQLDESFLIIVGLWQKPAWRKALKREFDHVDAKPHDFERLSKHLDLVGSFYQALNTHHLVEIFTELRMQDIARPLKIPGLVVPTIRSLYDLMPRDVKKRVKLAVLAARHQLQASDSAAHHPSSHHAPHRIAAKDLRWYRPDFVGYDAFRRLNYLREHATRKEEEEKSPKFSPRGEEAVVENSVIENTVIDAKLRQQAATTTSVFSAQTTLSSVTTTGESSRSNCGGDCVLS